MDVTTTEPPEGSRQVFQPERSPCLLQSRGRLCAAVKTPRAAKKEKLKLNQISFDVDGILKLPRNLNCVLGL